MKDNGKNNQAILSMAFIALLILAVSAFYGCESKPKPSAAIKAATPVQAGDVLPATPAELQATDDQQGYIYDQRGRRDPFVPLIIRKQSQQEKGRAMTGTLESYDLSEFSLAAIVGKAGRYYALIVTPDNRSFTVSEGTVIGINKGTVKEVTGDKMIMVEYSKDYMGNFKPREIILEFHKGD
ncbi:MAG: pilus assembly protein PilP [Nitrospirota bacterium]|nr:pilus assembly protein PilP [Nitrospirota bacterium]